jgi:hypothetical protein
VILYDLVASEMVAMSCSSNGPFSSSKNGEEGEL